MEAQNIARTMLRIPQSTRKEIVASATRNHRSMNAEIVFRLEQTLQIEGTLAGTVSDDLQRSVFELQGRLK